jgi:DNA-directed RNA polymerase specialized sigma24 family protein
LESSFRLLCRGPSPLAVDGRDCGPAFPRRPIPLTELAGMLLHPSTPFESRDRAVQLLVRRAQSEGGSWTIGLAGVLLPGLRSAVSDVARAYPESAEDLEADVLVEFVAALAAFDADTERVASRLLWRAAQRARRRTVREQAAASGRVTEPPPDAPHRPWGHPDFVLAEAVAARVLTSSQAELIGETRLGGVSVEEWAASIGWQPSSVRKRRSVAERRLVAWLSTNRDVPCRETARDASFQSAGRSVVVDEAEPARVAPVGPAKEVSPFARRLPTTGSTRPGLTQPMRRSA